MSTRSPLPIAVLISGGGTTLRNLMETHARGDLPVEFRLVVSSHRNAGGLKFAQEAYIATRVIERRAYDDVASFSKAVFGACRKAGAELVVMGGFLKHVLVPEVFQNRVINIHPALIPAFCGKGFYGRRVHEAVLAHGVKVSGCTVHFVDNEYDHGPIILQRTVPVHHNDTPESLAARVFAEECAALPEAIRLFAAGKLRVVDRRVVVG
jgi:phosphoribosylglycinamide formyltransferase-1